MIRYLVGAALLAITQFAYADRSPVHNPFKKPVFGEMKMTAELSSLLEKNNEIPSVRATLTSGQEPLAIVNDKIIGIGELINGYRLVSVHEGSVIFEFEGTRQKINVKTAESTTSNKESANAD